MYEHFFCRQKNAREKQKKNIQLAKNLFFFVSRWRDSMMWECFFPIISVRIIIMNSIMKMILIEHRLRRNLRCSSENFTLIIFSSTGKCKDVCSIQFEKNAFVFFREMLRRNYNSRRYWIDIELRHLSDYDDNLCDHLKKQPAELLPLV